MDLLDTQHHPRTSIVADEYDSQTCWAVDMYDHRSLHTRTVSFVMPARYELTAADMPTYTAWTEETLVRASVLMATRSYPNIA